MSSKSSKNTDKLKAVQSAGAERKAADDVSALYRHDLRASHGTDARGDELVKQAHKTLKKLFGGEGKYDAASELLEQAGAAYKMSENWAEAGDALVEAAELQESKIKNTVEASAFYASAAKAYRNVDVEKAIATFKLCVALHMENGRHASAARVWEDIAELQTEEGLADEALESYESAANCFESDSMNANAVQVYAKLAAIALDRGLWPRAGDLYEKAATVSAEHGINKGTVHEWLYMALLCFFVQSAQQYNTDLPRAKYAEYAQHNRRHEGTAQFVLVKKLLAAFDDEDSKAFTKAVFEHNKVHSLDETSAKCLLRIKQALKAGPPAQVTGGAADEAADDDYT